MATKTFLSGEVVAFTNDSAFEGFMPEYTGVTVSTGTYLYALGGGGHAGIVLTDAPWVVTVNGGVFSESGHGIELSSYSTKATKVTVGSDGVIFGGANGIEAAHGLNLSNSGRIEGGDYGLNLLMSADPATYAITNKGSIVGNAQSGILIWDSGVHTITNSGQIRGGNGISIQSYGSGADKVTNSGLLGGSVELGDGQNSFANAAAGKVEGMVLFGADADTFKNQGWITDHVEMSDGANTFSNTGKIDGNALFGAGADKVTNTGVIGGTIDLGGGKDSFSGGSAQETIFDGDGNDTIKLGGGDDIYLATGGSTGSGGIDVVDGGAGLSDVYDASAADSTLWINLDTIAHMAFGEDVIEVAAKTAFGSEISGSTAPLEGKDTVTGFEVVYGGNGDDFIFGNASANTINGNDGNDELDGRAGNDVLNGGAGHDALRGGAGADRMTGGAGFDTFYFDGYKIGGVTASTRDVISDFTQGQDAIWLFGFELAPNKFTFETTFIGNNVAFNGLEGAVRALWSGSNSTIVELDANGDRKVDLQIELVGRYSLTQDDFA